ncbi:MAG: 16S rRNA (adenine(1518)-N(6)/adenine(1519)-N(6))-dimethyltransferase RsmA [Bacteroidota bacterium]
MLSPKKHLGQNFLQDDNIIRKIVASLDLHPDDAVVEIGPGPGALTRILAEACRLTAIEVDHRAVEQLRERFGERVDVREADVLTVDAQALAAERGGPIRVVGNIPYYITSEILFWVLDQRDAVRDATLMMQEEVADRLVAVPRTKAYGILSVFVQHYAVPRRLFGVSRNCFYPKPDVDSTVVRLDLRRDAPAVDDALFRTVVRGTFGKRRKTIRNGLAYVGIAKDIIAELGSVADQRPEELTPEEFVRLTGEIQKRKTTLGL